MALILVSTDNISHEEWLEYRNQGIGGSDVSVVCGINRWKSPIELWMEKTGQFPYQEAGEAAYWGNRLEDLVKEEFTIRTGIEVIPVNAILQHEEYPFMLANLDGICQHPVYGNVVFEAKTAGFHRSGEWEGDSIPDEYLLQLQHYLAVTGYKGAYIAVLIGGNNFKWQFVERDEELIEMLVQLESEFWEQVLSGIPPALDGSEASGKFLNRCYPDSVPDSVIELPSTAASLVEKYVLASEKIGEYTSQKQEAENLLKQMMGEYEVGIVGDGTVNDGTTEQIISDNETVDNGIANVGTIITWKTVTQERLDTKAIKADHPTLCKKYTNQSTSRRFSVKPAVEKEGAEINECN
jgi:putative phage-type endonuclease